MFRNSIRTRLMALVLLASVIPSAISVTFSYLYTKQSVTEQSVKQNTKLLALGESNLSNYLSDMNHRAMSLYSGINVPGSFYTAMLIAKDPEKVAPGSTVSDNRAIISTQLYNLFLSDQNTFQIHLFVRAQLQSNLLLGGLFRQQRNTAYIPPSGSGDSYKPFVEVTHLDHQYEVKSGFPNLKPGTVPVFTAHFPIYRTPSQEVLADLSIDFQLEGLEQIAKSMYNSDTERLYMLNEQGQALYASSPDWVGQPVTAGWSQLPRDQDNGHFSWKNDGFEGIVMYRHINDPLFKGSIIKLVPYEDLYGAARLITRFNMGIGVLFLILGGISAVLISIGFTRPIKKLISFTQKVQIGQLDAYVDAERQDEFGLLTRKITDMTKTINNLIVKEYRLELANKTNQLKALQAQVNPHFLYNALQSIASSSLRYNAPKVYDLIYSLGSMMRYSMNTERTQVPLGDELEHVGNYLVLQRERFGEEELRLSIEAAEDVREIVVPKMILQPLVENIFKHGFADGIRNGLILISCTVDEQERLIIAITDNGKGMTTERLEAIRAGLERSDSSRAGADLEEIGLRNVLARLRLQMSEAAQLRLEGEEGQGLQVTLIIPRNGSLAASEGGDEREGIDRG
ncbi:sensor histidine kinase [Paenibacillus donghaensis]|uniref:Two-component sensor histidine kinase n=1 Tax=Paenibacillus donghaensis TaxID=414771 RepID=A0A2Z2KDY8_9BACL|nr:sensor histidine kinase [Paenibacillus donghaensis]ASA24234.1 two-component sensor histidine kinase [Paenibacillus donghaensis]